MGRFENSTMISSYQLLQKNSSRQQALYLASSVRSSVERNPRLINGSSLPGISKYPKANLEDYHLERGSAFNKEISLNKMVENLKFQVSNRRKNAKSSIDSGIIHLDNVNNISKFR